jgi:hypothetical protein
MSRKGSNAKTVDVDELLDSWVGPGSKTTTGTKVNITAANLGSAKAGLGYTSSNFNNQNNAGGKSAKSASVITNIETVSKSEEGLGYSTALEESIIKSNKRKIREEQQDIKNNKQNLNRTVKLHGFIDKDLDDDDEDLGKASIINKKSRIEYKPIPKKDAHLEAKKSDINAGNSNSNSNNNSSKSKESVSNKSKESSAVSNNQNDASEESFNQPHNASVGDKKHAWILERKTRTKTRSKQKNIRKDNRSNDAKPAHLQIGSKDYNGRPITKETKSKLKIQSKMQ